MKPWLRSPLRAGTGPGRADVEPHKGRRRPRDVLPAVNMFVLREPARLGEEGRRHRIHHPAGDGHMPVAAFELHRRLRHRVGAKRGRMDIGQMRQVEQVLDQQLVIGLQVQQLALCAPVGVVHPVEILDIVGIGQRRITHPDPHPLVPFHHRVGLHPASRRNLRLTRHPDTIAGGIVFKTVIRALDVVADQLSLRERRVTVRAFVGQCHGRAVLLAENTTGSFSSVRRSSF